MSDIGKQKGQANGFPPMIARQCLKKYRTEQPVNQWKADVVVVGAGNAALCAALSAREHGADVLVLEKAPESLRGGNSYFTGGLMRVLAGLGARAGFVGCDVSAG